MPPATLAGLPGQRQQGLPLLALGSEFAANACLHSRSGVPGGMFTVRAEVSEGDHLYVAVEDEGGPWAPGADVIQAQHGLDLAAAIAGPGHWGVSGDDAGRVAWARLPWPGAVHLDTQPTEPEASMPLCPADEDAVADLEKLTPELEARGLRVRLVTPEGRLPHLIVHAAGLPALAEKVYAQADWFFWPHAERIAACDDLSTAADTIARALSADGEPGA